jgi:hypothetical protein
MMDRGALTKYKRLLQTNGLTVTVGGSGHYIIRNKAGNQISSCPHSSGSRGFRDNVGFLVRNGHLPNDAKKVRF